MVSPVVICRPQTWKVAVHTDVRARSCVCVVCVVCVFGTTFFGPKKVGSFAVSAAFGFV